MSPKQAQALRQMYSGTNKQPFQDGRTLKALFARGLIYNLRKVESRWNYRLTVQGRCIRNILNERPTIIELLLK